MSLVSFSPRGEVTLVVAMTKGICSLLPTTRSRDPDWQRSGNTMLPKLQRDAPRWSLYAYFVNLLDGPVHRLLQRRRLASAAN